MDTSSETIIIVDDDVTTLNVARINLSEKYSLFTAPSGEKLFQLLEKVSPAIPMMNAIL